MTVKEWIKGLGDSVYIDISNNMPSHDTRYYGTVKDFNAGVNGGNAELKKVNEANIVNIVTYSDDVDGQTLYKIRNVIWLWTE